MASNDFTQYKDLTPAAPLDKKTLNRMAWRSCQLQACFNYERMQSAGWLWSILPGLEKIHTNKDDLATSMTHNMDFINTHPFIVTFVMGIVLSMEQQKMDIQTIRSVRISTAAPLGGIGDALFWMSLVPIVAGMTAQMAIDGNVVGPILYFIFIFGVEMALRFGLLRWSYNMGTKAITSMTKYAKEFTHAASVLGVFIVGALIANYGGGTKLGISIPNGETATEVEKLVVDGSNVVTEMVTEMVPVTIDIQKYFDMVLPCLIPLLITLLCFFLIKKKGWTPVKCIGLLLVLGIVGAVFGIWAGAYTPLVPVPWNVIA